MNPIDLSIIVPTYNERDNIGELSNRIAKELPSVNWELIFVDDNSPDGTAIIAQQLGRIDPRVRCIRRVGRRGLASACIEGMLSSNARFFIVMDADFQHDPSSLPGMYNLLLSNSADLVIASRYMAGGTVSDWDERRKTMSRLATRLAKIICSRPVSDPMSGFFGLKREVMDACLMELSTIGFKILLDIIASSGKHIRISEVPLQFSSRAKGQSKLNFNVMWEYILLILDKLFGKYIPVRFMAFATVGVIGIFVHMVVLALFFKGIGLQFAMSQAIATGVAIIFNYTLNNILTYAGHTLKGISWIKGLFSFSLICGIGAIANVGAANYLFSNNFQWALAAVAGIVLSAVWNYAVTAQYTWSAKT